MNYKKITQQYLYQWMQENNLVGDYDIHHRDDNDEVRAYNKAHYKRWGCNEDGTFEYGKYVIFLTHSEHSHYHNTGDKNPMYGKTGENNPFYGKHHTAETCKSISEGNRGKTLSDAQKQKLSEVNKGKTLADEHKQKISETLKGHHHTAETRAKMSATRQQNKALYDAYKRDGGKLKYYDFCREIAPALRQQLNLHT